jgi:hypothetical protein
MANCADIVLCCLVLQGLGAWASFAHQITNLPTPEVDSFVKAAIFATLTNVSLRAVSCSCSPLHAFPTSLPMLPMAAASSAACAPAYQRLHACNQM